MTSQDERPCIVFDLVTGQEKYGPAPWKQCCRWIETVIYFGEDGKFGIWPG